MPNATRSTHPRLRRLEQVGAAEFPIEAQRGKSISNKLDNPQVRGMLLVAAGFTTVELACSIVGVSPAAVYALRKRDPEFEEQWQTAKARAVSSVEMALFDNAVTRHNVEAQKFFLSANKPEVYRPKSQLEVSAPVETIEIVKAAAAIMRERRRLGTPVLDVVPEAGVAIVKAATGNGNGNGGG